jgi:WD40 repeat protein
MSSCCSRPVSRSGARAPEPTGTPELVEHSAQAPRRWRRLQQTISRGVNRVTARLGVLKRPLAVKGLASPCTNAKKKHPTSQEDLLFVANYSPSSISPMAVLTERRTFVPSTTSFASSDSATLAAWLAARQQASLEEWDYDPGSLMTLEEYERVGSWLDLSGDKKVDGKWVCGVPGCEVHTRHLLMHGGPVTSLDFPSAKENITQGSSQWAHTLRRSPVSSRHGSSTQFLARFSSARDGHADASPGDGSLISASLSDRREREMSMPGGWTF